jgi:hypothetical protein
MMAVGFGMYFRYVVDAVGIQYTEGFDKRYGRLTKKKISVQLQ